MQKRPYFLWDLWPAIHAKPICVPLRSAVALAFLWQEATRSYNLALESYGKGERTLP